MSSHTPIASATPGIAETAAAHLSANPSLSPGERLAEASAQRRRVPMSVPRPRLSTPEIPGFHCHWINDAPGRVQQAIQAGYTFVGQDEALVKASSAADDPLGVGTDLGSRVSIVVGRGEGGSPLRAYLMKLPEEFFREDQQAQQAGVDAIHDALRRGKQRNPGDDPSDEAKRYVKRVSMTSTYSRDGK